METYFIAAASAAGLTAILAFIVKANIGYRRDIRTMTEQEKRKFKEEEQTDMQTW